MSAKSAVNAALYEAKNRATAEQGEGEEGPTPRRGREVFSPVYIIRLIVGIRIAAQMSLRGEKREGAHGPEGSSAEGKGEGETLRPREEDIDSVSGAAIPRQ